MLLALTILFWILLVKGAHMREDGRQRRLSRPAVIGLSAAVALALGSSLAATQAVAAGYMANAYVRMRHPDYDALRGMLDAVGQTLHVYAS